MNIHKSPASQNPIEKKQWKSPLHNIRPAMRICMLVCILIAAAFGISNIVILFSPYGFLSVVIAGIVYFILVLILAILMTLTLAALKKLHWMTALVILTSIFLCLTTSQLLLYIVPLLISAMITVYFAVMFFTSQYKSLHKPKKIFYGSLMGLSGLIAVGLLFLIFYPGPTLKSSDRPNAAKLALPYTVSSDNIAPALTDPSTPGNYEYEVSYYTSLYANSITTYQYPIPSDQEQILFSKTADASDLLVGWNSLRRLMLGFDDDQLPLNAKVWTPKGDGPFPLVLIVHGNHEAGDRSDGGYDYLGELLASHGMIAASVDENFLNSSSLYDLLVVNGLKNENSTRAFVLLEHLQQWYEWNNDSSSPFFNKVDFDNLALIGHSRGGEAVALAAAFSQLDYYPDNGMVSFDYPFQIKTVVAIAPVDGQYDPAGLELNLKDVNYLVLHGEHDMDVRSFMGANTYRRADVSEEGIKAQVWIQYANHGQFNSSWQVHDAYALSSLICQERLLMPMAQQQQAAKVFIGAFLDSTLLGKDEYNILFKDFTHGNEWLPAANYVTDYTDNQMLLLDNYDGNYNLTTSSSGLVTYSAQDFSRWTIDPLPGKFENRNRVLTLIWDNKKEGEQSPLFEVAFEPDTCYVGDNLYLSLCSGKDNSKEKDVSFDICLTDRNGSSATMSINDFGGVVNPIDAPIAKPLFSSTMGSSEPVLQMVCIPTSQFKGLQGEIISMEWVIDNVNIGEDAQVLYVDDLRVGK